MSGRNLCRVKDCGAEVVSVLVDGKPYPVNPKLIQVVVKEESGKFSVKTGFQPHSETCVDIIHRSEKRQAMQRMTGGLI